MGLCKEQWNCQEVLYRKQREDKMIFITLDLHNYLWRILGLSLSDKFNEKNSNKSELELTGKWTGKEGNLLKSSETIPSFVDYKLPFN